MLAVAVVTVVAGVVAVVVFVDVLGVLVVAVVLVVGRGAETEPRADASLSADVDRPTSTAASARPHVG